MSLKPKILFIPNFLYLSVPYFENVMRELGDGYDMKIVRVSSVDPAKLPHEQGYCDSYFKGRGLDYVDLRMVTDGSGPVKMTPFLNYSKIRKFVKEESPSLVIMATDLGDFYNRLLIDECRASGAKLMIMSFAGLPQGKNGPFYGVIWRLFSFPDVPAFRFLKARCAKGGVELGRNFTDAYICAFSEKDKDALISSGIDPKRIRVAVLPETESGKKEDIRNLLRIPDGHRTVTFFSQHLEKVFGQDYVNDFYQALKEQFHEVDNAVLVIKLHPRELPATEEMIRRLYVGEKFRIVKNEADADALVRGSDLMLTHYSFVIAKAVMLNRPFLSINLMDKAAGTIPQELRQELEINDKGKIGSRVRSALFDRMAMEGLRDAVKRFRDIIVGKGARSLKVIIREVLEP